MSKLSASAEAASAEARANQRRAADPAQSVWVRANAGSGKTRVLVERVIRLLLAGNLPDKILCLTFTKAAAAEMKERLYAELARWAGMDDDALIIVIADLWPGFAVEENLDEARRLFARALETPGGLKVQTIHGFCQAVLERFPAEAGVAPAFQVIDEQSASELKQEALARLIERSFTAAPGDEVAHAFAYMVEEAGEFGFQKAMGEVIGRAGPYLAMLQAYGEDLPAALATHFGVGLEDEPLAEAMAEIDIAMLRQIGADQISTGQKSMVAAGQAMLAFADTPEDIAPLKSVLFTQTGSPKADKSLATKNVPNQDGVLAYLHELQELLADAFAKENAVRNLRRALALATVARQVLAHYGAAKAARAVLDYDDLVLKTRDLLHGPGGASWVHYKLDQGISHILVDEAQDTSPEHWTVIAALAEEFFTDAEKIKKSPRTVFSVGDEKQSIYRFQGAAPKAFAAMAKHFAALAEEVGTAFSNVPLSVSFRSTPEVLGFVDTVFGVPETGAGLTAEDEAVAHTAFREGAPGLIEVWPPIEPEDSAETPAWDAPLDMPSGSDPKAVLAARISETIASWLDKGMRLPGKDKAVRPSDIMVLVRKRSRLVDLLVAGLKKRGVPVAGADRMMLAEQMVVKDLLALGRFALLPEDDLNLAGLLKSPFFGFDEDAIFKLAHGREGSMWSVLRRAAEKGDEQADQAVELLSDMLGRADYLRPFDWYTHILVGRGGRAALCRRLGTQAHDPIDAFLALALQFEQDHIPSLEHFVHATEHDPQQIKRDMDRASGEVRIMTVHGAKGLESDIVFLPDIASPPSGQFDPAVMRLDGEGAEAPLMAWAGAAAQDDPAMAAARAAHRAGDQEEYRRLLYVALTRARDRLYICGFEGKRRSKDRYAWTEMIEAAKGSAGRTVKKRFENGDEIEAWQLGDASEETGEKESPAAATTPPLPEFVNAPLPVEPAVPQPLSPSRLDEGLEPAALPALADPVTGIDARERGTIIHRLIEVLPGVPAKARPRVGERFAERMAPDAPVQERKAWVQEAVSVLANPAFAAVFDEGSMAEVPIAGHVPALGEGTVLSGQIDRLVVSEKEVLVVDFKTNRTPPEDAAEIPEIYIRQMAAYKAALEPIYPGMPVRAALLWTAGPSLMEVPENMLDAALERAARR